MHDERQGDFRAILRSSFKEFIPGHCLKDLKSVNNKDRFKQDFFVDWRVLVVMGSTNKCKVGSLSSGYVESRWRDKTEIRETASPPRQARPSGKTDRIREHQGGLPGGGRSKSLRDWLGRLLSQALTQKHAKAPQGFIRNLLPNNSGFQLQGLT